MTSTASFSASARRRLIALLVPLAVSVIGSATADAQAGLIHGRVIEVLSREPLEGVLVSVLGTVRAVATDSDGHFSFPDVMPGRYEIQARIRGGTVTHQPAFVRGGDSVDVTFTLTRAAVSLVGVEVVGAPADALERLPGSAAVVTAGELQLRQPLSGGEVLRSLAGVHVQEEEGAGLRANVGIRGLDPDRSRTLLVLEDGVPVALAPYGEPEMYYTPPVDRMERLELVKGSGSILFGPQTIGGVLNYVTAEPPAHASGSALLQLGSHGIRIARLGYGGTWRNLRGSLGVLEKGARDVMGLHYDVRDVTAKLGTTTRAGDFGFKASLYDESSNATYVGLTEAMYRADPRQHPAPDDRLRIRREALTASHELAFGTASRIRTSLYAYHTVRDWRRQDYGFTADSSAHVFTGTTGNRNREFHVIGLEPRLRTTWIAGGLASEFEAGLRAHYERARDQHINGLTSTASDGELRDDEVRRGRALALFAQNRFFVTDELYVTPGVRVERFTYDRNILRTRVRRQSMEGGSRAPEDVGVGGGDGLTELIPGIGTAWTPSGLVSVFAGVHRGFAPPRVKDALVYADPRLAPGEQVPQLQTLHLDAERSVNYELGARLFPLPYLSLEATGFLLDFTNQIIAPSLSAGAVADVQLANQGATRHRGAEAAIMLDIGKAMEQPFGLVARVAATHVNAVFSRDRFMRHGGDTVNVKGNRLPYAPRFTSSGSLTFMGAHGLELRTDFTYVSEQFADNFETRAASATGLVGAIPAHTVWDASARARLPYFGATVTGTVKNLFGVSYVASRRPEGIKPGLPRTAFVGLDVTF
ncbi:MAG TPA: TonB-dependent receptor [Gemmatimonadaceae bacterium]|nr:TonB-dependent receptor [Gemmatimonadaceae bacterium]